MDLAELTVSRRTVHSYKPVKVEDSLVEKALELSLWAPNHKLSYPWAYFWTGPASRAALAQLAAEIKAAKDPSMNEVKKKAVRDNVLNPSHLIVLGLRKNGDPERLHEDYATLSCSVQIASLALWEEGVTSKWSTGKYFRHPRAYEILQISPDEFQLEGALMIGVPLIVPAAPQRPPLAKFLHRVP